MNLNEIPLLCPSVGAGVGSNSYLSSPSFAVILQAVLPQELVGAKSDKLLAPRAAISRTGTHA